MGLAEIFRFKTVTTNLISGLPKIFDFETSLTEFVNDDMVSTFQKILTDCVERTQGIPDALMPSIWDNCLESEANMGLISLLAHAMVEQADLFLIYKAGVLRVATREEQEQIKVDYEKNGKSSGGYFISFKTFRKSKMFKVYSTLEYCVLASLNKSMHLSQAIQLKIARLRESVSAQDSALVEAQAVAVAEALSQGKDVLLDEGDSLEFSKPDMESTKQAINFINEKKAFLLGLPLSYVTGEQTTGIGSTGEADMRAVERGLKYYYNSILKAVFEAIFGIKVTFKSEDFRNIDSALNALRTLEMVSHELLPYEDKWSIVRRLFNLPEMKPPVLEDPEVETPEKEDEKENDE